MSLKKLLGLEDSSLHEEEIFKILETARASNKDYVEIPSKHGPIILRFKHIEPLGIFKETVQQNPANSAT